MSTTARVIEVFPSIQGEGIHVGRPHLFVRFWDCNLACRYCDTDYRGPYREMTEAALLGEVKAQIQGNGFFHAVSLTGGEPLLWWRFLKDWLPRLKTLHPTAYLETNGTLPAALEAVLPWIDIVAMDLKPSSATGDRSVWEAHEAFLRVALEARKDLFVKVVVTADTADDEIERVGAFVRGCCAEMPVVLQPVTPPPDFIPPSIEGGIGSRGASPPSADKSGGGVTPCGPIWEAPSHSQLERWRHLLNEQVKDVRVIPQVHRILGMR